MLHPFEQTSLWRQTLGSQDNDPHERQRETLRATYLQFRSVVEPLAAEIALFMPMFTDHSIVHIDSLWDTASLVCGDDVRLNPAEAFVLGGAFLLHDIGMGLASYPEGQAAIEDTDEFKDLVEITEAQLRHAGPEVDDVERANSVREQALRVFLRQRHADQAEQSMHKQFRTSKGETFYLLQDTLLRHNFGSLIGRIARSHGQDVSQLHELKQPQGACVDHPPDWEVDPLKVACVLRLADAVHIDQRRASLFAHAFRRPSGHSADHWRFQEHLTQPRVVRDRLEYTASRPFKPDEAAAWWLAYEMVRLIDRELRQVDALCADLGRPRFAVRSVVGADSPERLAAFIRTDGWKPIDAEIRITDVKHVVSSLGGRDLYGDRPDVAVRELISNAADALRARRAHEDGAPVGPVTVRLSQEDGTWYLTVSDQGIGMDPHTMVNALTNFGRSQWQAAETLKAHPRLSAKGFKPTGRFGIGFFAVFMVADEVKVRSRAYDEAPYSTHVLEFLNGISARPLLRRAQANERLRQPGTVVRVKLRHDPRSENGLFQTADTSLSHTLLLHSRLTEMCALLDVDLEVQGPQDPQPVRLIEGGDWIRISSAELFRRLNPANRKGTIFRISYEAWERIFTERAQELKNSEGEVIGRAMLASGWELFESNLWQIVVDGKVYVGGVEAGKFPYFVGAFTGKPLTADRLKAFPEIRPDELCAWVESQAELVANHPSVSPWDAQRLAQHARGLGAVAAGLPCAHSKDAPLDRERLTKWLENRDIVLLIDTGFIWSFHPTGRSPVYATFPNLHTVILPDSGLLVNHYTGWEIPEEIAPRPRDEQFADLTVEDTDEWHAPTWWYDTGSFGSMGLVVRTIAKAWDMDIVDAVNLIEPLDLREDSDNRLELQLADGGSIRVDTFRMRRPARSVQPEQ